MKVTCPYCDSYVEVDETAACPLCGAPLGEAVKAAEEKEKAEQAAAEAKATEAAEAQAKEQTKQTLISAAASVLGVAAGSLVGRKSVGIRPMPPRGMGGPGGHDGRGPKGGTPGPGSRGPGNRERF